MVEDFYNINNTYTNICWFLFKNWTLIKNNTNIKKTKLIQKQLLNIFPLIQLIKTFTMVEMKILMI